MVKIYVFELKKTRELYAYTSNKKVYKRFLKERGGKCFHHYVLDMEALTEKEKNDAICKISFDGSLEIGYIGVLFDGKYNMPILMTSREVESVNETCNEIYTSMDELYKELMSNYGSYFNKKELKTISMLTDFIRTDDYYIDENYLFDREVIFNQYINSFKVFYDLFGFTMDKNINIRDWYGY